MKAAKKHTFYPVNEVEEILKEVPRGQLSERVNELLLKGLALEKQNEIALAYQKYNDALAREAQSPSKSKKRIERLSEPAFQIEDEEEGFI